MAVTIVPYKSMEYNELQFAPQKQSTDTEGGDLSNYRYEGFSKYFASVSTNPSPTVVLNNIQLYPSSPYNISAISIKTSIRLSTNNKARTFFVYSIRRGTQITTIPEFINIGSDMFYTLSQFLYIDYDFPNNRLTYNLPLANQQGGNRYYVQGFYKLYQSVV